MKLPPVRKIVPIAFRFVGVGFQATLTLLVTAWCRSEVSDTFFACWASVQIWSVMGQFGNGWRACIELSQERAGSAAGRLLATARYSVIPTIGGAAGLAVVLRLFVLDDHLMLPVTWIILAWIAVYLSQTGLLMVADLMRGLADHTAANLVSTGLATGLSAASLLALAATGRGVDSLPTLAAAMTAAYVTGLTISLVWFAWIWRRAPAVAAHRSDDQVAVTGRQSTRFFFLRLSQVALAQGPVILLGAAAPAGAATCFALGQRLTVCSSIFSTYLNATAPSYLAGYLRGDAAAIAELRSLVRLCFGGAVVGGLAGVAVSIAADAYFGYRGAVTTVYLLMMMGQWASTATAAGPAGQTLIAAEGLPFEVAAWLPGVLVFAAAAVALDFHSAAPAAALLAAIHLLNGVLGNWWLCRLRGLRLDIVGMA